MKFLILTEDDNKEHPDAATATDNDFIIMEDLNEINNALSSNTHLRVENERCSRLDSCQSPDQFFVNMVNEFLNDDTTPTPETPPVKTSSPLNIEYQEEANDNTVVEGLIDFASLNESPKLITITKPTTSSNKSFKALSSQPSLISITSSAASTTSVFRINDLTDDTRNMNTFLNLNTLNQNLPSNVKEISYQRFGRFNTNLPAEVHNFKCHLCAFSCAWKEVLLQHFQDKHPT